MKSNGNIINQSVIELLELTGLDSPFASALISDHKKRLIDNLLSSGKIDQTTAQTLRN